MIKLPHPQSNRSKTDSTQKPWKVMSVNSYLWESTMKEIPKSIAVQ